MLLLVLVRVGVEIAIRATSVIHSINALGKGSIVEFEFNKHTCIGVVDAHMVKAKGGLRYEIKTSDGKLHAGVAPRDIHFSAPPRA